MHLYICIYHGAHSGEERGTRDEDKLKITVFNIIQTGQDKTGQDKAGQGKTRQDKTRQGRADTQEHRE